MASSLLEQIKISCYSEYKAFKPSLIYNIRLVNTNAFFLSSVYNQICVLSQRVDENDPTKRSALLSSVFWLHLILVRTLFKECTYFKWLRTKTNRLRWRKCNFIWRKKLCNLHLSLFVVEMIYLDATSCCSFLVRGFQKNANFCVKLRKTMFFRGLKVSTKNKVFCIYKIVMIQEPEESKTTRREKMTTRDLSLSFPDCLNNNNNHLP